MITREMIMNRHCGFDGCRMKEEEKSDDNFDLILIFIMGIRVAQIVAALQPGCEEMERE